VSYKQHSANEWAEIGKSAWWVYTKLNIPFKEDGLAQRERTTNIESQEFITELLLSLPHISVAIGTEDLW